jgi:hypothetical protein
MANDNNGVIRAKQWHGGEYQRRRNNINIIKQSKAMA